MRRKLVWFVNCGFVFALALVLATSVNGQTAFGTMTGLVTDQTDAAVPEADVTVTNLATGLTYTVKSDPSTGVFRVEQLPPGRYKVEVSKSGFKKSVRESVTVNAGVISRVDFKLEVGQQTETMTIEAGAQLVSTEEAKLAVTIGQGQVGNLPLNGRNPYDLIRMAPGATDVRGVSFENGASTVVNGLRPNFNGFLINGVSNKGLSGGVVTTPNPDLVEEFQMLTLNMSAQYGNSAGSLTNVITKSGGNAFHGSAYYFLRRDGLDANDFFRNQNGVSKSPLEFNQFGGTINGPVFKDKLFFSASYQGERFTADSEAVPIVVESAAWRQAVIAARANSVAALLYQNFAPSVQGTVQTTDCSGIGGSTSAPMTVDNFVRCSGASGTGFTTFAEYMCPAFYPAGFTGLATQFQTLFGVTAQDQADWTAVGCPGAAPALAAGQISRAINFLEDSVAVFQTQTTGNLFNGNEWSTRLDYVARNHRFFGEWYWLSSSDKVGPGNNSSGPRGFLNPFEGTFPNLQLNWIWTVSPTIVNEAKAGYARSRGFIDTATPGVPSIGFDDGSAGFGSYNGYPQFFTENIYSYSEMLSVTKGKHNMKMGVDFRRNLENSEFNVARPSYYFFDQFFFALDAPYAEIAGVDPGFATGRPAELATNIRYWRNIEMGAYFNNDWKIHRRLTLNLGIRYDLYTRHVEKYNRETTYIPGPGNSIQANGYFADSILTANIPRATCAALPGPDGILGTADDTVDPTKFAQVVLAGVCGPGGFAQTNALGGADHNNFGPRIGVAWDVFGNAKTVIRGGYGMSFEGTLYNPLSNSRWNPPFYSFNLTFNPLGGGSDTVVYGPTVCAPTCVPSGATPTFSGTGSNPGQGSGAQATGNIIGYDSTNSNTAFLTGIVFPEGIRDPFVNNYFVGIQREIMRNTVLEVNWVATRGFKLFRAEQANRLPGIRLPAGTTVQVQGRTLTGLGRRFLNPNYGNLRVWLNVSSSWYDGLQVNLRRAMTSGLMVNFNYTWSHSLDTGSGWHSGAVTANGGAAGDAFSLDVTRPELDKGNSTFDIRHRAVINYVWEIPWMKDQQGFLGKVFGGWQYNGIWSFQTGAHWTAYQASPGAGNDYNRDGTNNDRPDAPNGNNINAGKCEYANGYFNAACGSSFTGPLTGANPFFGVPCAGCNGELGRNTFEGPGHFNTDQSLFKNFKIAEGKTFQFRFEMFNAFNRANFLLPSSSTGANFANRINSTIFGKSAGTLGPRQIQFGFKFLF
jgi:hypothetical protein